MKVLELYSGIGGMHFALNASTVGKQAEVIMAVEMNTACNEVYAHNFPKTKVVNRNVCSLSAAEINEMGIDTILMSPPCQPFTRLGKQKDLEDNRNLSLLQFIDLLSNLNSISYILLENVKGFEESETRRKLIAALHEAKFTYKEFLLNPVQFKICNSRLRYYLLAKRASKISDENKTNEIIHDIPQEYTNDLKTRLSSSTPSKIEEILQYNCSCPEWDSFLVSFENVNKYYSAVDIVTADDEHSCCFTGGYRRYLKGTGSLLTKLSRKEFTDFQSKLKCSDVCNIEGSQDNLSNIYEVLQLRYFTPKEVARLMTYPERFNFPSQITEKQKYKMLSNSINIHVVSFLISYLVQYFPE